MIEQHSLFMLQLFFDLPRLYELAKLRRIPNIGELDSGYIAHCALGELFGDLSPVPFCVMNSEGKSVSLLAYSKASKEDLIEKANSYANSLVSKAFDWSRFQSKKMPSNWKKGMTYSFQVRACPVRRMPRGSKIEKPGKELDAFIAHCHKREILDAPADRAEIYAEWLKEQFEKVKAAKLIQIKLISFKRTKLIRRTQEKERKAKFIERPDAIFTGRLVIDDPDSFGLLINRGVGRHKSFGFGMLLLKP